MLAYSRPKSVQSKQNLLISTVDHTGEVPKELKFSFIKCLVVHLLFASGRDRKHSFILGLNSVNHFEKTNSARCFRKISVRKKKSGLLQLSRTIVH